ncbi:MAG: zinc-dependent dehydrogenase [Bacillota bacterium]
MKVSYWYNNRDIRITEEPVPEPRPQEMLIKVHACGICGSDIVEWYRLPRAPLVQGHELVGEVVQVGSAVKKFKPGDRVVLAPKVPCMDCYYCRKGHYPQCSQVKERLPGGFAEYVLAPGQLVDKGAFHLPEHVTYDQGTFIEPLACVIRALRLADLQPGQKVLVLGCGMSGLLTVKYAKERSAKVLAADINEKRLEKAGEAGADYTVNAESDLASFMLEQNGRKADLVMLCTSALPAVEQAWQCLDKGGAVVFFAVPDPDKQIVVPINEFWRQEIRILTSYYCGPKDLSEAFELISSGRIEVENIITHVLPLNEIQKGFNLAMEGKDSLKVIIRPNEWK